MRPIKYTDLGDGRVTFHHNFTTLRKFLSHGFKEGNNGFILIGQDSNFLIYKGFGTIENPCRELRTVHIEHDPILDGKMFAPENIINPPKVKESTTSYRAVLWNAHGVTKIQ